MMDMGPYYLTAMVNLLGGVSSVTALTRTTFPERTITSKEHFGETIDVHVPTYLTGMMEFESGIIGTLFTTFDVYYTQQARFEVYGTKGTLVVPDPNTFGGPVMLLRPEDQAAAPKTDPALAKKSVPQFYNGYKEMPLLYDYNENSRALGLADMCKALRTGRDHRANYQQQRHVLEIMTSFSKSSETGAFVPLTSHYTRTAPMGNNPMHGILDD